MSARTHSSERGAVVVLVAIWLPVLALLASFAIDMSHWFDYSRNLQTRADAAALAAGAQYGNTCAPSSPSAAAMKKVGEAAQLYSGPGSNSDLPYLYGDPLNDFTPTGYQNLPTLQAGTLDNYHVFVNAATHWVPGQTSGPVPAGESFKQGTVCAASYPDDQGGKVGPITDVWVTQSHLPLFFPLLNIDTNISAHARVELQQGTGGDIVRPIAVRDSAAVNCATVNFITDDANHTVQSVTLTKDPTGDPRHPGSDLWDNAGTPLNLNVSAANLIVQPVLGCGADATTYDPNNQGVEYINTYGTTTPSAGQAPRITTGGVFLTPAGTCTDDQYFSTQDCGVIPVANVAFDPGINPAKRQVTVTDLSTGATKNMNAPNSSNVFTSQQAFTIAQDSGSHLFRIDWEQNDGTITGLGACTNGAGNVCKGSFGVQAQAFGACNGCDPPDDSGPMVAVRIRLAGLPDGPGVSGRNAFSTTAAPSIVVELTMTGLKFDVPDPATPPEILRVGTSTDQATGLIDCGQNNGASFDQDAIVNGCPLFGTPECLSTSSDFCAPLKIYDPALHPNGKCDPELRQTSDPAYTDCVETVSGTRRSKIPEGIADRVIVNGQCSTNNWPAYANDPTNKPIPSGDPRAVTFIITQPADLSKNSVVPIKNFATFYVTGWDTTGAIPNCNPPSPPVAGWVGNEPFPGKGKQKQSGAIWGHWITYTDPTFTGSGTFCDPTQFGVCATVLTR